MTTEKKEALITSIDFLDSQSGAGAVAALASASPSIATAVSSSDRPKGSHTMERMTTKDVVELFYKDCGRAACSPLAIVLTG